MQIHDKHEYIVDEAHDRARASYNADITNFVSGPLVMASAAGWYVGAVCWSRGEYAPDSLLLEPWDRYSDYMTEEDALVVWFETATF